MIKYITFKENGLKDLSIINDKDIYVISDLDYEYGLNLAGKLDRDFYPRAKNISKSILGINITRDVFSGYKELTKRVKDGSIITTNNLLREDITLDKDIFDIENKKIESNLSNSKLVFLVGRGIGSKENYERVKALAKKFGAEIGCTRPVCMNGWESYDRFVGISGLSLNSKLVVTFGVSGSGPLIKGLENVEKIIAINNDKNALIFNYSDYGIVSDLLDVIKRLESEY